MPQPLNKEDLTKRISDLAEEAGSSGFEEAGRVLLGIAGVLGAGFDRHLMYEVQRLTRDIYLPAIQRINQRKMTEFEKVH